MPAAEQRSLYPSVAPSRPEPTGRDDTRIPARGGASLLVLNAGSSSLKFALFDRASLTRRLSGAVSEIGREAHLALSDATGETPVSALDHSAAIQHVMEALERAGTLSGLAAAGHRVVHGGVTFAAPTIIDGATLATIEAAGVLAPLHNPPAVAAIRAVAALRPGLPQVACFDTAFHADNPPLAVTYALPERLRRKGARRYGFHGLSYSGLVRQLPVLSGRPLPHRLLAFHLGNGASLAAIRDGRGIATTMGFSPLDGLVMGTRAGALDPGLILHLQREEGLDACELERLLNRESGLLALSGDTSDMRALLASKRPLDAFAVEHFCYWAARHAGSMIAAMEGVDALAFTGGIGERAAPVRARIMARLGWTGLHADASANAAHATALHSPDSLVAAWIVPADEEAEIARAARELVAETAQ